MEKVYEELKNIRSKDKYPNKDLEEYIVTKIFPKNTEELALTLSNVTATFYGYALKIAGKKIGMDEVNSISKSLFRELGKLKTKEAIEKGIELPEDTRALAIVFISAVYTSSPEYNFELLKYEPEETLIRIFGKSRYLRIARKLNINTYISWPVLIPFFEGIAQQLSLKCIIEMDNKNIYDDEICDCLAKFKLFL